MKIKDAVTNGQHLYILSYRAGSASAKALAKYLSQFGKCSTRSRDPVTTAGVCIGWGLYNVQVAERAVVLNQRDLCVRASDKRIALDMMSSGGVPTPEYTNSRDVASEWLAAGDRVVARHVLSGHSGRGIQIVHKDSTVYRDPNMPDDTPWYAARLYTKYFKKTSEYRVFVVQGKPVLAYRKGLSSSVPEDSRQFLVRTHATGWNFCSVELSDVPQDVLDYAVKAQEALGLDFCAADIGWHEPARLTAVFEVNTAPGLEGSSVKVIGDALLEMDTEYNPNRDVVSTQPTALSFFTAEMLLRGVTPRANYIPPGF